MPLPIVVHIITQLELGGAQQNTLDSCRLLDRTRYRVALLTGVDGQQDGDAARIDGLDLRFVSDLVRPISPRQDVRAFRAIRGHIEDIKDGAPVIVHTHSSKAGILGRLAARAAGVRHVVHTIHGFGHPAFRRAWMRQVAIAAERYLAPRTSRFIAVSKANIEDGERLGLFKKTPVELIRSGFDLAPFRDTAPTREEARRALGLRPDAIIIGTVACLKPQKAPLDFVEAAARVARSHPDVEFVIAGDGELRDAVLARIARQNLTGRIHLLGWRDDVPVVLRALDLFWLTSRWEGLPRAVVQAMAAGVPVIATGADGVRDVIEDGVTGLTVAPGDITGIVGRTERLLDDPDYAARLADAARTIPDEFNVHLMAARLESLYDRLLGIEAPTNAK